jgi:acyl-coenzyme A synthetase/AMP-(fatty) acid ligase
MSANIHASGAGHGAENPIDLLAGSPQRIVAIGTQGPVDQAGFLRQVHAIARRLPAQGPLLNLCDDRYRFLLGFAAALTRGLTTLLPPSRAPGTLAELLRAHPDAGLLGDCGLVETLASESGERFCLRLDGPVPEADGAMPRLAPDLIAAIGFTSGSSGPPQAHPKYWSSFCASTACNDALLAAHVGGGARIVATVPSQHMYGMETAVLLPMRGGVAIHDSRPFFPADVAQCLASIDTPRVLVTTPVHLRALLASGQALPPTAAIVSATAPLSTDLAQAAERAFDTRVIEVFGSTETCVIGHRRTAHETEWTHYDGVQFAPRPDGTGVSIDWLPAPVLLQDVIERQPPNRFRLAGRASDHLEIAGKRASLIELTRRLLAIPGVEDGVVFQPDQAAGPVRRVAALVVAPTLEPAQILAALRDTVDPVFLPRPLQRVPALPRNATGKLPLAALLALQDPTPR